MTQPTDVVAFRLDSIEESIKEMRMQAAQNAASVELRLAGIQAEIKGFQLMMPDHYMPRREAEAQHADTEEKIRNAFERVNNLEKNTGERIKSLEDHAWGIILAVFVSILSAGVAITTWFVHKP